MNTGNTETSREQQLNIRREAAEHRNANMTTTQRENKKRQFRESQERKMNYSYSYCSALKWIDERCAALSKSLLKELLMNNDPHSREFKQNIRAYNSALAFTSVGAKIDENEQQELDDDDINQKTVTIIQYYSYRLQVGRFNERINIHLFGHLFQQYIVDTYTNVKQKRLGYLWHNQKKIHAELYNSLHNAMAVQDEIYQNLSMTNIDNENLEEVLKCETMVYDKRKREWKPRQRENTIRRMYFVHPRAGEHYYLRMLLNTMREATSFENLRTINGVIYATFKNTCSALSLLQDNYD
ncbi:6142_t:CDS:2 [Cetraspora pellucida]|uniref:6142_t:CDS:1 n=1 Tax=Cetraspora pellucida TaxID=1433469 RepID=A0A9N9IDN7_9GLOM|nr:6142_t:CDS:2 [Cetraspora pellucida]